MGLAIEMYFDAKSEDKIKDLWREMAEAGISSKMPDINARPHVSLAVLQETETNMNMTLSSLEDFARQTAPFSLNFSSVSTFPTEEGVVFLAPVVTQQLLSVHERFHALLKEVGLASHDYYLPGNWVPHCTLAFHLPAEEIATAVAFCQQAKGVYGRVQVESVGLVAFSPITELAVYPFQGNL